MQANWFSSPASRRAILAAGAAALLAGCSNSMPGAGPFGATAAAYPPSMPVQFRRQTVSNPTGEAPGTVVIDTNERFLYLVEPNGTAVRYGVGVGREGFGWTGEAQVGAKREWPAWVPPPEMLERRPDLPLRMEGGPENPLGARALYLYRDGKDTLFRIHGTNEPKTIGQAMSSGCIRMVNFDVEDLYERVPMGAKVVVR